MFERILVQVDPSRPLKQAPVLAQRLAKRFDAELTALYIVDEQINHLMGGDIIRAMDNALAAVGKEALDDYEDQVSAYATSEGTDIAFHKAIGYGDTPEVIARYVMKHGVDLVVTGGFHHSVYTRIPFGSIVNEIIRSTPCSVLLARDEHPDPTRPGPIVTAYDDSVAARRALHVSAAFAAAHGQTIDAVHVGHRRLANDDQSRKVLAAAKDAKARLPVDVETHPLRPRMFRSKPNSIIRHARSRDASLIALASHRTRANVVGGLSPLIEHLVIHTDRPLLVIHP